MYILKYRAIQCIDIQMPRRNDDINQPVTLTREMKGHSIAFQKDAIKRLDENTYQVRSQSGNGSYVVAFNGFSYKCACPDHVYRNVPCKHIIAIQYSQELRREVQETTKVVISQVNTQACLFCKSSNIVKFGIRHNKKAGDIQKFRCNECMHYFTVNLGFEKIHATPKIITTAMQLYFTGESLRNVQKFIKLQGLAIDHTTVYRWIKKYTGLMEKYLEKITPNVSNTWRTDEIFLKIKGDTKYLYAIMDDETRFWIAASGR
jgi:putative transposase